MKTTAFVLVSLSLALGSAPAALITVHFAGSVTFVTPGGPSYRSGAPMVGYFTYDPQLPPGYQSAASPSMVLDFPENNRLEMNGFSIGVRDNFLDNDWTVPGDGLRVLFNHPIMQSGGGGLSLDTTDTTLFSNANQLPTNLPPLARFNASSFVGFHYDFQLDYWAVGCAIEALVVTPGPATGGPIIFRMARGRDSLSFHFIAEPTFIYTVEFTQNLASGSWGTLTNVVPTTQKIEAVIRDTISPQVPRIYRVRKNPTPP